MSKLPPRDSLTLSSVRASAADETEAPDAAAAAAPEDPRAWAEAAMQRCSELEKLLRQVVLWFDSPLEAANDDNDTEVLGAAVDLNRLIDRAIALLDGKSVPANGPAPVAGARPDEDEEQDAAPAPAPLFVSPGFSSIN